MMRHFSRLPLLLALASGVTACGHKSQKNDRSANQPPTAPGVRTAPPAPTGPRASGAIVVRPDVGTLAAAGAFLVQVEWLSGPSATSASTAKLTFADAQGHGVQTISDVAFNPWMPAMGHGTSLRNQTITAESGNTGVFSVQKIDFIMGGDWQLQITATVNGHKDTANVPVKVP